MATSTQTPKTPKAARPAVDLVARTKAQLSTAALKSKITVAQLDELTQHVAKLKSLLS